MRQNRANGIGQHGYLVPPVFLPLSPPPVFRHFSATCGAFSYNFCSDLVRNPPIPPPFPHVSEMSLGTRGLQVRAPRSLELTSPIMPLTRCHRKAGGPRKWLLWGRPRCRPLSPARPSVAGGAWHQRNKQKEKPPAQCLRTPPWATAGDPEPSGPVPQPTSDVAVSTLRTALSWERFCVKHRRRRRGRGPALVSRGTTVSFSPPKMLLPQWLGTSNVNKLHALKLNPVRTTRSTPPRHTYSATGGTSPRFWYATPPPPSLPSGPT